MTADSLDEEFRDFKAPTRHSRRRRRRRKIKIGIIVSMVAIFLGVAGGYLWLRALENRMGLDPEDETEIVRELAEPKGDHINILLVGTDKRLARTSERADSIVFIRADKRKKTAHLLSIPRDTRVNISGRGMDKINHSWAFGGAPLLLATVKDYLDLEVNYFFKVDFAQFEKAVDAMGGVDFDSSAAWYDGELGVQVREGLRHRGGKEAMALVRNRRYGKGGGSDLARVSLQQDFLKAMIAQSVNSYADVPGAANVVSSYVSTNMGLTEMIGVGRIFAGQDIVMESAVLPGRSGMINGVSYIIPDLEAKAELVGAMENGQPFPRSDN